MKDGKGQPNYVPHDEKHFGLHEELQKHAPAIAEGVVRSPRDEVQSDEVVERYATPRHQQELRERIEAQQLPVKERAGEIKETILQSAKQGRGIILLQGETGSGKSIYSPVILRECLKELQLPDKIVVMQPRRDAASNVAAAIAAVSNETLGRGVGFSTSETKKINRDTNIGVITSGIFLRHMMEGRFDGNDVGAIILDEVHEGTLDYHLVLGLLKRLQREGKAPLTILTSATLNKERIQEFFDIPEKDYLKVEGRAYSVEQHFCDEEERRGYDFHQQIVQKIQHALTEQKDGDVLVFMPGVPEINDVIRRLQQSNISDVEVLPLHANIPPEDRSDILAGRKKDKHIRRIIVSTNIAETSVTVPGVRIVVDSGLQRTVSYNPDTGIIEKNTGLISRDQAVQRAGRAGRISEGVCYRMMTEKEFNALREHPESEISQSNLSHLVLRLKKLGIDPEHFDFIEPPNPEKLHAAMKELQLFGAVDEKGTLTELGREMAETNFEPRIARMVIEARKHNCVESALVVAAFDREGKVLLGPGRRDTEKFQRQGYTEQEARKKAAQEIAEMHNRFASLDSDLLKYLNIFEEACYQGLYESMESTDIRERREANRNFEQWCQNYAINAKALRHIASRLYDYAEYAGITINNKEIAKKIKAPLPMDLTRTFLAGYIDRIVCNKYSRGYRFVGQQNPQEVLITSSSAACKDQDAFFGKPSVYAHGNMKHRLCIASHIEQGVRDGRNYADGVHPIEFSDLVVVAPHLLTPIKTGQKLEIVRGSRGIDCTRDVTAIVGGEAWPLGDLRAGLTGQEMVDIIIDEFLNPRGSTLLQEAQWYDSRLMKNNLIMAKDFELLNVRAQGELPPFDLREWYAEKLEQVKTLQDIERIKHTLELRAEDLASPSALADIELRAPLEVTIGGVPLEVQYNHEYTGRLYAELSNVQSSDWVLRLKKEDIPVLGKKDQPIPVAIRIDYDIYHLPEQWEHAQLAADNARITSEYRKKYQGYKQGVEPIEPVLFEPLPVYEKEIYATNRQGIPVYAYPAVTLKERVNFYSIFRINQYFEKRYYQTAREAQSAFEQAQNVWRKLNEDAEQERRREEEIMARQKKEREESQKLYPDVLAACDRVIRLCTDVLANPKSFYLPSAYEYLIAELLSSAQKQRNREYSEHNHYGSILADIKSEEEKLQDLLRKKKIVHEQKMAEEQKIHEGLPFKEEAMTLYAEVSGMYELLYPSDTRGFLRDYFGSTPVFSNTNVDYRDIITKLNKIKISLGVEIAIKEREAKEEKEARQLLEKIKTMFKDLFPDRLLYGGSDYSEFWYSESMRKREEIRLHIENCSTKHGDILKQATQNLYYKLLAAQYEEISGSELLSKLAQLRTLLGPFTTSMRLSVHGGEIVSAVSLQQPDKVTQRPKIIRLYSEYEVEKNVIHGKNSAGQIISDYTLADGEYLLGANGILLEVLPHVGGVFEPVREIQHTYRPVNHPTSSPLRAARLESASKEIKVPQETKKLVREHVKIPKVEGEMTSEKSRELEIQLDIASTIVGEIARIKATGPIEHKITTWHNKARERFAQIALVRTQLAADTDAKRAQSRIDTVLHSAKVLAKEVAFVMQEREDWPDELIDMLYRHIPAIEVTYGGALSLDGHNKLKKELIRVAKDRSVEDTATAIEEMVAEHMG